jgi:homocysteine S-methyltransferase
VTWSRAGKLPQIVALGINCIALENTTAALKHLQSLTSLPLVVYPNSGEHYDAVTKTWHHHGEACETLAGYLPQWLAAGAKLIGGCCRTTPKDIAELNAARWVAAAPTRPLPLGRRKNNRTKPTILSRFLSKNESLLAIRFYSFIKIPAPEILPS